MKQLQEIIYGKVVKAFEEVNKANKLMWSIKLKSSCGDLKFRFWDYNQDNTDPRFPQKNQILKIRLQDPESLEKEYRRYKSLVLKENDFIYIEKEDIPQEIRKEIFPTASKEKIENAIKDLSSGDFWIDANHHEFVLGCIKFAGLSLFTDCPAATTKHHDYKGGLLVHTHEVFKNALSLYEANKDSGIKKDVLLAGAWLHDIGKTVTYFIDEESPECTEQENKVGHPTYSCSIVYAYALKSKFKDQDFLNDLMHCIASHHGRIDWNAIVEPKTIEAHILHTADNISSKMPVQSSIL
jgi:3'-5' exoribonuclease